MKIEPKHVFTHTKDNPQKKTKLLSLATTFKAKAPIIQNARPLKNRIQIQKTSKADQKLTKSVQSIIGRVPTPFIKR